MTEKFDFKGNLHYQFAFAFALSSIEDLIGSYIIEEAVVKSFGSPKNAGSSSTRLRQADKKLMKPIILMVIIKHLFSSPTHIQMLTMLITAEAYYINELTISTICPGSLVLFL